MLFPHAPALEAENGPSCAVAMVAGATRTMYNRRPPLSKNPRAAYVRKLSDRNPPKLRVYSVKRVTRSGCAGRRFGILVPGIGPLSAMPMNAAVDVLTPSIGFTAAGTSWT